MKVLRIGGVPEHFNLPWHLAIESGELRALGVDARWRDYPEGSGAMAAALGADELDCAMLLTEGAAAGVAERGGFSIVSLFTESPLIWGIHVPADSTLQAVADLERARYAISRLGSGSHLMSVVHARERGWRLERSQLVVVRTLQGAIEAFAAGTADVFLWEKFMTKPLVDAGRFRRIGEFVAPWPAFVVCASAGALATLRAEISTALRCVLRTAGELAGRPDRAELIASRYGLRAEDVAEWLRSTRWASKVGIEPRSIAPAVAALRQIGMIDAAFDARGAITTLTER
jgi:ABC-type nitrate/sulfonate/bicarbonate transport system substrate-binding protein